MLEYELKNEDLLYFLHIPKTAGTSFFDFLENQFEYHQIHPRLKDKHFIKEKRYNFSNSNLLRGHIGYGIYQSVSKNLIYVTMLRSPIDQVLSRYAQFTSPIYMDKHPDELTRKIDLLDMLNDEKQSRRFFNPQTRFIASDLDITTKRKNNLDGEERPTTMNILEMEVPEKNNKELLQTAKKRLEKFKFVGLTEYFKESIWLLCYTFGWKPTSKFPQVNLSKSRLKKENISSELTEKILENTKLDRDLYEFGKKIFENRYATMIQELTNQYGINAGKSIHDLLEKKYYERTKFAPHSSIEYTFEKPLLGTGWHLREYLRSTDTVFRWTGPSTESTIEFQLQSQNNLKLEITILSKISEDALSSLQIYFNENKIEFEKKDNKITGFIDSSWIEDRRF